MGDNTRQCKDCGKACWGKRCKKCSRQFGVRGHSRQNAQGQRVTMTPRQERPAQRGSWWVDRTAADFTAHAQEMVVPDHKIVPYNWQVE